MKNITKCFNDFFVNKISQDTKLWLFILCFGVAIGLYPYDLFASAMEFIAPIKSKGTEIIEGIKMGWGVFATIVLLIQIARAAMAKDPQKRSDLLVFAGQMMVGAIAIYNFDRVLALVGVKF